MSSRKRHPTPDTVRRTFDAIRQFQRERCDKDFYRKYFAWGSGIAFRTTHGADPAGDSPRQLCLRLYVDVEKSAQAKKAIQEPFVFRAGGVSVEILVEICPTGFAVGRSAFLPDPKPLTAGISGCNGGGAVGTLGGWAWNPRDASLVLVSCAHVLRESGANVMSRRPEPDGMVAGKVEFVSPLRGDRISNRVDCAFANPTEDALAPLALLEEIEAIENVDYPDPLELLGTRVVRYKRWGDQAALDHGGGEHFGVVDAVSVHMEVSHPSLGTKPWFEDLFSVLPEREEQWSIAGDSGMLVYDRTEDARGSSNIAIGLLVGGADLTMPDGNAVGVGLHCSVAEALKSLGLEKIGPQVLCAFLDSVFETGQPLDFLKLRRAPGKPYKPPPARARELVEEMLKQKIGLSLVDPVKSHRHTLIGLLARDRELAARTAKALSPVLTGKNSPEEVFAEPLTDAVREELIEFIESLRSMEILKMRGALQRLTAPLNDKSLRTVGAVLRKIDEQNPAWI